MQPGNHGDFLLRLVERRGTCSISPYVLATTGYFFDDCHYNDGGSALVGKLVSDCLIDQKVGADIT